MKVGKLDGTIVGNSIGKAILTYLILLLAWWLPSVILFVFWNGRNIVGVVYSLKSFFIWIVALSIFFYLRGMNKAKKLSAGAEAHERLIERMAVQRQKSFDRTKVRMAAKGKHYHDGQWVDNINSFMKKRLESNKFQSCYMKCMSCGYVWKIVKRFGLPAFCVKCRSTRIELSKKESYGHYLQEMSKRT